MSGRKWRKALRGDVDFRSVARLLRGQLKSCGGVTGEL